MEGKHIGRVARRRKYFAQCYDSNPAWRAERKNDRVVFRKIRRETAKGLSARCVIANLYDSNLWANRMTGKTPKSWKGAITSGFETADRVGNLVMKLKQKNHRFTLENIG